jgi:hypothetical protein
VLRIYAFGYGPQHDATGTLHNETKPSNAACRPYYAMLPLDRI